MWMEWGVSPNLCVIGHSFGEVAAAMAVGALDLTLAVRLMVSLRQIVSEKIEPGRMVALMADESTTRRMIREYTEKHIMSNEIMEAWIDISALNSPTQTVVSGPPETMKKFATFAKTNYNMKSTFVKFAHHAYHSRSLAKALIGLEADLGEFKFLSRNHSLAYISSMYGRKLDDSETLDPSYWSGCFKHPVQFIESATAAISDVGARLFLEVGPQPTLSPLMQENCSDHDPLFIPSLCRNVPSWNTLSDAIATLYLHGVKLDWTNIWTSLVGDGISRKKVPHLLPTYPFQNDGPFWFNPCAISGSGVAKVNSKSKVVHPLLGSMLSVTESGIINPVSIFTTSTDEMLYRTGSWLRDHKVGPYTIFPAAGYIEMGFAVVTLLTGSKGKSCGIRLSQIDIQIVLSLDLKSEIQTNVIYDGEKFNISIFSRREIDCSEWRLHASLNAIVLHIGTKNQEKYLDNFAGDAVTSPYVEMSELGYKFGRRFRSLTNLKTTSLRSYYTLTANIAPRILDQDKDEIGSFVVHPTILDALVQAAFLASVPLTTLRLPIAISTCEIYPHLRDDNYKPVFCPGQLRVQARHLSSTLFVLGNDSIFRPQVSITKLKTFSTTVKAIGKLINEKGNIDGPEVALPMFVEEWTSKNQIKVGYSLTKTMSNQISSFTAISRTLAEIQEYHKIASFIGNQVAITLKCLGNACLTPGERLSTDQISSGLCVNHIAPAFLARLLHYAGDAGLLKKVSPTEYVVLPHSDFVITEQHSGDHCGLLQDDWAFAEFYISKLSKFLRGSESILPHLFPPTSPSLELPNGIVSNKAVATNNFSAERLYSTTTQCSLLTENLIGVFASFVKDKCDGLRILEVGAGTGAATRKLLRHLHGTGSTYTFTDISTSFLNQAEGFEKEAFDIIIAMNVLHATTDLGKVVGNLRLLLGGDGNIFIAEQLRPSAFIDIVFGHCKGYWLFKDTIRSGHCLIDGKAWKPVLQSAGYGEIAIVENRDFDIGIIVATNKEVPLSPFTVITTSADDEFSNQLVASSKGKATLRNIINQEIRIKPNDKIVYCLPHSHLEEIDQENQMRKQVKHFLTFSQALLSVGRVEIFIVSHGLIPVQDEEAIYPVAGALRGFARSLANEMLQLDIVCIDPDEREDTMHKVRTVLAEIKNKPKVGGRSEAPFVTYRDGVRYEGKLVPLLSPYPMLAMRQATHMQLRLPESCAVEDLKWDDSLTTVGAQPLAANQIQVRVHASGLNFKDILSIIKPTVEFTSESSIGADICGQLFKSDRLFVTCALVRTFWE
ncbi:highly reducing polyketide synthase FUM1-like [Folsomia candida]|uniref:highly reducing polyketide synthase FUM1-like n=1 Tax=Folsomia candida TaxID=158441 RepID=UPI001604CB89|nr:highly reducing polyketide synthase FUM1-like [Folsomia candida]